jgi:hypothetical protein
MLTDSGKLSVFLALSTLIDALGCSALVIRGA